MNQVVAFRLTREMVRKIEGVEHKFKGGLDGNAARELFLAYARGDIAIPSRPGPAPMVHQFLVEVGERARIGRIKKSTLNSYSARLGSKDIAPLLSGSNEEAFLKVKKWVEDGCPTLKNLTHSSKVEKFLPIIRLFSWAHTAGLVESAVFPEAGITASRKPSKPGVQTNELWEEAAKKFRPASKGEKVQLAYDSKWRLVCSPFSLRNLHASASDLGLERGLFHKNHYDVPEPLRLFVAARATMVSERVFPFVRAGLSVKNAVLACRDFDASKRRNENKDQERIEAERRDSKEHYWESCLARERENQAPPDWVARAVVLLREARMKKVVSEVHQRRKAKNAPYLKLLAAASSIANFTGQNKNLKNMAAIAKQKHE